MLMSREFWKWLITRLSQTYSREASCSAKISKWLVKVITKVYLDDRQDMATQLQRNTNPVYDFAL